VPARRPRRSGPVLRRRRRLRGGARPRGGGGAGAARRAAPVKEQIEAATGRRVVNARPVGGGCINEGWRAELDDGRVAFVKTRSDVPPGEYENEAAALDWLAEPRAVNVPEVLGHSGLVLAIEWVEEGRMTT